MKENILNKKVRGGTMENVLFAMAIVGIIVALAVVNYAPQTSKAKALEAQEQLKFISTLQEMHHYQYSKYSNDLQELDFIAPKTVKQGGPSNYAYEILNADFSSYKVQARAVVDFNKDGKFNLWEVDENNVVREVIKD